jgi:large subunit ribosomal protein L5
MAVPKLDKIVVSMGLGKVHENKKAVESAPRTSRPSPGQRPVMTHSRMAVSNFRLREGVIVGAVVTLRGARMYEFLDRLISVVIPRIRDFRGLQERLVRRGGNYSMGLPDQIVFPEIRADKVEHFQGMNVTIGIRTERRRVARTAASLRHAVPQLVADGRTDRGQHLQEDQVDAERPKFKTRHRNRCRSAAGRGLHRKFHDLPHLLPEHGAPRRDPRCQEGVLVTDGAAT